MSSYPDNGQDIVDSRDVIAAIKDLESQIEDIREERDALQEEIDNGRLSKDDIADLERQIEDKQEEINDLEEELKPLTDLQDEAEGYCDWINGATLIHEDYFTQYAMELLSNIGDLPQEIPWYIVIDEEATAENIRQDYTAVDFGGVTYYVR